jgi:hypothetical protein
VRTVNNVSLLSRATLRVDSAAHTCTIRPSNATNSELRNLRFRNPPAERRMWGLHSQFKRFCAEGQSSEAVSYCVLAWALKNESQKLRAKG